MTTAAEFARATNSKPMGGGWYMGRCTNPSHNDSTASMKSWDGPDGKVRVHCFGGCNPFDVRDGAVAMGALEPFKPGHKESPIDRQKRENKQAKAQAQRTKEQAERDREGTRRALTIWSGTNLLKDTLGERHLIGRHIKWLSPNVRFHEELYCARNGKKHPAIVFALRDGITRKVKAVQSVYLGEDVFGLISAIKPKITVGSMAGAAVQFAKTTGVLALAEGPETAMSYWQLTGTPSWSSCGTANLCKVNIPPQVTRLIIAGDNDDKGREAAHKAAATYAEQGFAVEIHLPQAEGYDWNNHLIEGVLV